MAARKENLPPMTLLPPGTPIRPHSPSAKPLLALQRDHSACASATSSPLVVRKTRQNTLEAAAEIPPPCHGCAAIPQRQKSITRRVLSAVRQGLSRNETLQTSETASTVSTAELVTGFGTTSTPEVTIAHSIGGSDGTQTQEPCRDELMIPYIDLQMVSETSRINMHVKQDIWIAIIATVHLQPLHEAQQTAAANKIVGQIPSMRIHIQAAPHHRVLQTLGDKTAKELKPDDSVDLFVRLRVPTYRPAVQSDMDLELETAYSEIESLLGTLESDMLYVEARYRHTLIGGSSSVSVRRTVKVKRSDPQSCWDVDASHMSIRSTQDNTNKSLVHERMSKWVSENAKTLGPPWM